MDNELIDRKMIYDKISRLRVRIDGKKVVVHPAYKNRILQTIKNVVSIDPVYAANTCYCGECIFFNGANYCAYNQMVASPFSFCSFGKSKKLNIDENVYKICYYKLGLTAVHIETVIGNDEDYAIRKWAYEKMQNCNGNDIIFENDVVTIWDADYKLLKKYYDIAIQPIV